MYFREIVKQGYDKEVEFHIMEDDTDEKMCEARCALEIYSCYTCRSKYLKSLSKRTGKEIYYFDNFGTFPKYRGNGYARKMLQHVKEYYKGKIIYLFVCSSGPLDDDQLIEFYKSEGFRQYKTDSLCQFPLMGIEL